MKSTIFSILRPLVDFSPVTRRWAAQVLARHFRRRGALPEVVDAAVERSPDVAIGETMRLMQWGAAIHGGAAMPRAFRPDVELRSSAVRRAALRSINGRLQKASNIQLERQRIFLDDDAPLDDASEFVASTLEDRLQQRVDGAHRQTLRVRQAFSVMESLLDRLEAAGHRPFLVSGTLLGVVREGDLLQHDYDVDIGLLPGDGTVESISELLRQAPGFVVHTEEHRVLANHHSGIGVDIFLHYERDGLLWHATTIHEWWNQPFELVPVRVRGREFLIPDDSERYLEENYGDWRSPVTFYHMSFDTPNRVYRQNKHAVLYLYGIFLTALETSDRFVAESAARELRDAFGIDLTGHFADSPLLRARP